MQQILEELETVKYILVMVDTSNHKNLKLVPVPVRYFIPRKGVQTKVTEFHNLKGETADVCNGCTGYVQAIKHNYCFLWDN
jgi:hypothetical protein